MPYQRKKPLILTVVTEANLRSFIIHPQRLSSAPLPVLPSKLWPTAATAFTMCHCTAVISAVVFLVASVWLLVTAAHSSARARWRLKLLPGRQTKGLQQQWVPVTSQSREVVLQSHLCSGQGGIRTAEGVSLSASYNFSRSLQHFRSVPGLLTGKVHPQPPPVRCWGRARSCNEGDAFTH